LRPADKPDEAIHVRVGETIRHRLGSEVDRI
jgi:hypothetical protein